MAVLSVLHMSAKPKQENLLDFFKKAVRECNLQEYGMIIFCSCEVVAIKNLKEIISLECMQLFDLWNVSTQNSSGHILIFVRRTLLVEESLGLKLKFSSTSFLGVKCQFLKFKLLLGIFFWPKTALISKDEDLEAEIKNCDKLLTVKEDKPVILLGEMQEINIADKDIPIVTTNKARVERAKSFQIFF